MSDRKLGVNPNPCSACPYRRDCPSGVWDALEYVKLPQYDRESIEQGGMEPIGVFLCHDDDRKSTVCKGWLDVHGVDNLLAVRVAAMQGFDVSALQSSRRTKVKLFASGLEACVHGLRDIDHPSEAAKVKMALLKRRHPDIQTKPRRRKKVRS